MDKFFETLWPLFSATVMLAGCQLLAHTAISVFHLPVSTPVAGMFLLFVLLAVLGETPTGLRQLSGGLLRWLTLMFVPAGVGVMLYFEALRYQWIALLVTMMLSTAIAMAFTGWLLQRLLRGAGHD